MTETYKKKPHRVEAMQFDNECEGRVSDAQNFVGTDKMGFDHDLNQYFIKVGSAKLYISKGDYIVKGITDRFHVIEPDIFERSYKKVPEEEVPDESGGEGISLEDQDPEDVSKDDGAFTPTPDSWLMPKIKEAVENAKEEAESVFTDWLKEKHGISQHASRREEYMKECTHPEVSRINPDKGDGHYPDDLIWHCTACGYVKYEESE